MLDLVGKVADEGGGLLAAHAVRGKSTVAAVPELWLVGVARERRRANPRGRQDRQSPSGSFAVSMSKARYLRLVPITRIRVIGRQNRPPTSYIFRAVLPRLAGEPRLGSVRRREAGDARRPVRRGRVEGRSRRGARAPSPDPGRPAAGMTATGQVVMLKVGGRTVYRTAG